MVKTCHSATFQIRAITLLWNIFMKLSEVFRKISLAKNNLAYFFLSIFKWRVNTLEQKYGKSFAWLDGNTMVTINWTNLLHCTRSAWKVAARWTARRGRALERQLSKLTSRKWSKTKQKILKNFSRQRLAVWVGNNFKDIIGATLGSIPSHSKMKKKVQKKKTKSFDAN